MVAYDLMMTKNLQANVVVETANEEHAVTVKERLREVYPTARFSFQEYDEKRKAYNRL